MAFSFTRLVELGIQSVKAADIKIYFTFRVLLYQGGAACQWTLRYVVLKYLYEETVPC